MKHERVATPHGEAILLALEDVEAALARLPAAEQALARSLGEIRRRELVAGRTALHLALDDFSFAILPDDRGAPMLPAGYTGSVSHKGNYAAAIVAPSSVGFVGLDLERAAPPRMDIATRILTEREREHLPAAQDERRGRAVTLRFAIKEAIYKAIDPVVRRYVGFTEVEVEVGDEACTVSSGFPLAIEASWREHANHWLATARAVRR